MIAFTLLLSLAVAPSVAEKSEAVRITPGKKDADGFLVHNVVSPYQAGTTQIRVLLPDVMEPGKRYPVIYLLPVEAGRESRYGDGLVEAKKHNLHNRLQAIFVAPTFSHLPWYADHPTQPTIRQETYFLQVVVPFIEKQYPTQGTRVGRLLLGFSKSGWGAFSLLLRYPDRFAKAAAWDAPLMEASPNRFGMGEIFGTQQNFEKHQITKLLREHDPTFRKGERLIFIGRGNFQPQHEQARQLMNELRVSHVYREGTLRKHDWHSGWVTEAAKLLMGR